MQTFLWWIGCYNLLGAFVMAAMHHPGLADMIMRRGTEVIAIPYTHGDFGRLWVWWVASTQLFLGAVMMLSTRWAPLAQREVTMAAIAVYIVMYLVMLIGGRKPKYGRGIYITHILWLGQIGWGAWALWG